MRSYYIALLGATCIAGGIWVAPAVAQSVEPAAAPAASTASPATDTQEDSAPADDGDVVVVRGFRQSVDAALGRKKNQLGIHDVILADDIASFPEQNLAESLQRIPGVSITRDSNEGRQISLRGLGPEFTRTHLNGMEVLTNTASGSDSRGSVSRSRNFDYSIFASELFNQIDVAKTFSADQDEGGIGGTVGLRSAKPFDYQDRALVLSVNGQTNSNTKTVTPRVVALASKRFGDFGALVSAAYSTADINEYGYRNWSATPINLLAKNVGAGVSAADAAKLINATGADRVYNGQAMTYSSFVDHRTRLGLTGALQYHPNDRTDVTLDLLYGRLTNRRDENVMAAAGINGLTGNVSGTQVLDSVVIDKYNTITKASWRGVDLRSEHKQSYDATNFFQAVLNGHTDLSDTLRISALAGYSRSKFSEPKFDKTYLMAANRGFSYDLTQKPPRNSYNFDLTDPNAWTLMRGDVREDYITSSYRTGELSLTYRPSDAVEVEGGLSFRGFRNEGYQLYQRADYINNPARPKPVTMVVNKGSLAPFIVGDIDGTFAATGQNRDLVRGKNTQPGSDFRISEDTLAGYVLVRGNGDLGGVPVKADFGVRYYRTDLTSEGTAATAAGLVPLSIKKRYDGFLPAANLTFELTPKLLLRAAASRNISRPNITDLRAAANVSFSQHGGNIAAGNPALKPFTADSADIALEYYDGNKGYASLAVFAKNMDSFITTENRLVAFGSTGYPASLLGPGQDGSTLYNFTAPINGPGANIVGVEAAVQRNFDFLPAPFDGLGFIGNATYAKSDTDILVGGKSYKVAIAQLSRWSANTTLFYEKGPLDLRASFAFRDRYRTDGGADNNVGTYIAPQKNLDVAARFRLSKQWMLRFDGINITNEPIVQYKDSVAKRLETYTTSGRTFTAGISYSL